MIDCPRCEHANPESARFCGLCGLSLTAADDGRREAGRVPHPQPLPPPAGFELWRQAQHLYFHWQSAWGASSLLGTEPLRVAVFNAGYPLACVQLQIRAVDRAGATVLTIDRDLDRFPRGVTIELEVPSYDINEPVHALDVRLVGARFDWEP